MCTFKNLEEIWKTWRNFEKTSGNPVSYVIFHLGIKQLFYAFYN